MVLCSRSVNADAEPLDACAFQSLHDLRRKKCAICCKHYSKPGISTITRNFKNVRPGQRLASAKDENGFSKPCNFINEIFSFFSCKFTCRNRGSGSSPAVYAIQVAPCSQFPCNKPWCICHGDHKLAVFINSIQSLMRFTN